MTSLHVADKFALKSCLSSGGLLKLLKALDENSRSSLLILKFTFFSIKMQDLPLKYVCGN